MRTRCGRLVIVSVGGAVVWGALASFANPVVASAPSLVQISSDPYTNGGSQHATENEPSDFAWGSTIVASTQVGRNADGGSANIGWATSTDNGATWTHGFFTGLTTVAGGPNDAGSDTVVAYDAAHRRWLDSVLGVTATTAPVEIFTSADGLTWDTHPHIVANGDLDKNWVVCDNHSSSPFYGYCYSEWDAPDVGGYLQLSTSTDGGLTWSAPATTADAATGIAAVPQVLPNGTVVMPFTPFTGGVSVFTSSDGGNRWSATRSVATQSLHDANGMRAGNLVASSIDGDGRIYVAWNDCVFRSACSADDIVYTSSTDGNTWSPVSRIPIDPLSSTVEHFTPGFAADPNSHAPNVHLGVSYDFMPNASCSPSACQVSVGFVSSTNGGSTWSAPMTLNPTPMLESWMPISTGNGSFLGDYQTTAFSADGSAHPVFEVASAPTGSTLHQSMYTESIPVGTIQTPTPAGPPVGVAATSAAAGSAKVSWTAPTNNGGSAVQVYYVLGYSAASNSYVPAQEVTGTSATFNGLTPNTYYIFIAADWNGVGWSPYSNWSSWLLAT